MFSEKTKKLFLIVVGYVVSIFLFLPLLTTPISYRCPPYLEGPINVVLFAVFALGTLYYFIKNKKLYGRALRWPLFSVGVFLSAMAVFTVVIFSLEFIGDGGFPENPPEICRRIKNIKI